MKQALHIQYLQRHQLSEHQWNQCIAEASHPLLYAQSWYLDAACDQWDALVLDDYKAVMPLPWRKKWGIRYVYQPPFIQRLGVFGKQVNDATIRSFFDTGFRHFVYIHANFNQPLHDKHTTITQQTNFIINLALSYPDIRLGYSAECKKNIRQAKERDCRLIQNIAPETVIAMYRNAYGSVNTNTKATDYTRLKTLAAAGMVRRQAATYGVVDEKGTLLYAALIFNDLNRLYYLLGAPNKAGRTKRATYFFIDQLLQLYAGSNLLFDFEGSDLPNVAAFYQRFGPAAEHFYTMKINRLPVWLRWIK